MKTYVILLVIAVLTGPCAFSVFSQSENIWLGSKEGRKADWFVAAYWSKHRIPNTHDRVIIPAGRSYPIINGTASAQAIFLEPGAELLLGSRAAILVLPCQCNDKSRLCPPKAPVDTEMHVGLNNLCQTVLYQGAKIADQQGCPLNHD